MYSQRNNFGSGITEATSGIAAGLGKIFEQTASTARKTATSELRETLSDVKEQIAGIEQQLEEGAEIQLGGSEAKQEEAKAVSAEHREYVREVMNSSERVEQEDRQQLRSEIEEIRIEIMKLQDASSEMNAIFQEVSTQGAPVNPGKYHLTFYEWVLISITNARKKMEEVNVLGKMFQTRQNAKGFKAMAASHGTSFTMNHERSIVRQTG